MATQKNVIENSAGSVGIGTTSPTQVLELKKTTGSAIALLNYNDSVKFNINASSAGVGYVGMVSNHDLLFVTNDTERARVTSAGCVGIGTTSARLNSLLTVNGSGAFGTSAYGFYVGTDATGAFLDAGTQLIRMFTGQQERIRIDTNGNLGIGTTSPSGKLHVYDNGGSFRTDLDATYHMGILNEYVSTYVTRTKFGRWNNTSNLEIYYDIAGLEEARITRNFGQAVLKFNRSSTTDMIIDGSGNVGIGTTSPSSTKLHIVGDWASGHSTVKVQGITDNTTGYGFYDTAGSRLGYLAYTGAAFEWYNNANVPIIFYTNTSEKMRIASGGNVGIGTTSPSSKLYVSAGTLAVNTRAVFVSADITTNSSVYTHTLNLIDSSADANPTSLALGTYSHVIFRNRAVSAGSAGGILDIYTRGVSTDPTVKMTITDVGNVGIGTTTVRSTFHLNGDFIRDTNIPYSWGTSAPFRTFSGAYGYANGGVNGPNRFLLLWPQISAVNGQNGRFVNARLIVARGATHAFNDTTIGDIVATAGYNSSANLYSYTPLIGAQLYFYNIVYNGVTYLAISLPISDFRWELSGHFGIEETAYYSPTFVYANTSGVGTITQLTDYTNESVAIYNKGGNIGVNTTSPVSKLSVVGTTSVGDGKKLSFIGLDINSSGTPTYIKITTTIPFASGAADFTVNIKGFRYGNQENTSLQINWHYYLSTFYNATVSSAGSWAPTVRLSAEGGFVAIVLSSPGYWPKLYVESMYSSAYNDQYASGWTWSDADATGSPIVTLNYKSNFGNSFVMLSNGNVGIGSTGPAYKLDVNGYIASGGSPIAWFSGNYNRIFEPSGNVAIYLGNSSDPANYYDNTTHFFRNRGGASNYAVIEGNGNLGIGTSSVTEAIHVYRAANSIIRLQAGGGNVSGVRMDDASSAGYLLKNRSSDTTNNALAGALYTYTDSNKAFQHIHNGTPLFTILSGGSVGIGTSAPSQKLDVSGIIKSGVAGNSSANYASLLVTSAGEATTQAGIGIQQATTEGDTIIFCDYEPYVEYNFMHENSTNQFMIHGGGSTNNLGSNTFYNRSGNARTGYIKHVFNQDNGNMFVGGSVGIGTSSPAYRLQLGNLTSTSTAAPETLSLGGTFSNSAGSNIKLKVYDDGAAAGGMSVSAGQMEVNTWSSGKIAFYRGTTQTAIIDNNGNVGIGTSSPAQKLHVVGAVYGTTYGQFGTAVASGTNASFAVFGSNSAAVGVKLVLDSDVNRNDLVVATTGNVGIGTSTPGAKLNTYASGSNLSVFKVDGGNGTLFEVTDNLSGSLFSVNDVSGLPLLEVFSNNRIVAGKYGSNALVVSGSSVGIGTTTPAYKLQVNGSFAATTKSFVIQHPDPSKSDKQLVHGVLEGPEHSVFVRGILKDTNIIQLPDYWQHLVHEDSVSVTLTSNKYYQQLYVKNVTLTTIEVGSETDKPINCYYYIVGERKDIDKLIPEI